MLLSDYCMFIRPYVEEGLSEIDSFGKHVSEWNCLTYHSKTAYLDDAVKQIINCSSHVDKDIDYAEALRLAGIIQGYLTATDVMGKVVKDQNPLRGIFGLTGG